MLLTDQDGPLPRGTIKRNTPTYLPGISPEPHWSDLVIGDFGQPPNLTKLATAAANLPAGQFQRCTVLGQTYVPSGPPNVETCNISSTTGAATSMVGNGTLTDIGAGFGSGALAVSSSAFLGMVMRARNAAQFDVSWMGPEYITGLATVGTPFRERDVTFLITAGSTPFATGDQFSVQFVYSASNFTPCVKTATDGSQVPIAILADDANFAGGPDTARVYTAGFFNSSALIIDPSWTLADMVAALQPCGIFCK